MIISSPQSTPFVEGIKLNIILVAKYSFAPESENELQIKKGDILKLLSVTSGWLLVKFIDKIKLPGLIPASYIDIAINDQKNPVTLSYLNGKLSIIDDNNYLNLVGNNNNNDFNTINNTRFPVAIEIGAFLSWNKKSWYRLDVTLSDGTKVYIARLYQDFYKLHGDLLLLINSQNLSNMNFLPKLPEPLPSDDLESLIKRLFLLNSYITSIVDNKSLRWLDPLVSWVDLQYDNLPGFVFDNSAEFEKNKIETAFSSLGNADPNKETVNTFKGKHPIGVVKGDYVDRTNGRKPPPSIDDENSGLKLEIDDFTLSDEVINEKLLPGLTDLIAQYDDELKKREDEEFKKLELLEQQQQQEAAQAEFECPGPKFEDVKRSNSKNIFNNYHQAVQASTLALRRNGSKRTPFDKRKYINQNRFKESSEKKYQNLPDQKNYSNDSFDKSIKLTELNSTQLGDQEKSIIDGVDKVKLSDPTVTSRANSQKRSNSQHRSNSQKHNFNSKPTAIPGTFGTSPKVNYAPRKPSVSQNQPNSANNSFSDNSYADDSFNTSTGNALKSSTPNTSSGNVLKASNLNTSNILNTNPYNKSVNLNQHSEALNHNDAKTKTPVTKSNEANPVHMNNPRANATTIPYASPSNVKNPFAGPSNPNSFSAPLHSGNTVSGSPNNNNQKLNTNSAASPNGKTSYTSPFNNNYKPYTQNAASPNSNSYNGPNNNYKPSGFGSAPPNGNTSYNNNYKPNIHGSGSPNGNTSYNSPNSKPNIYGSTPPNANTSFGSPSNNNYSPYNSNNKSANVNTTNKVNAINPNNSQNNTTISVDTTFDSSRISNESTNTSNTSPTGHDILPNSMLTPKAPMSKPYSPRIHHPQEKNSPVLNQQIKTEPIPLNNQGVFPPKNPLPIPNSQAVNMSNSNSNSSNYSSSSSSSSSVRQQFIKCKITKGAEIFAVKLDKMNITNVDEFKFRIKQKVFFKELLIKLPYFNDYENIDKINLNLVEFLKHNDKVLLKVD